MAKKIKVRAAGATRAAVPPLAAFMISDAASESLCVPGYTRLDRCPEVITAVSRIAEIIGMITIHIKENTPQGDKRIENELSKKIDIAPCEYMTRKTWLESIVNTLLLHGNGNSVVRPHTERGLLGDLEPIPASRVSFIPNGRSYYVDIDGVAYYPDEVLHFVKNPDAEEPWRGRGLEIALKDITGILRQATHTEKKFMESPKPSIIVKVDALADEFAGPAGREKLLAEYVTSSRDGEPWLIPAEQFSVDQVKPLTLSDLAISDTVKINKESVAAVFGMPAFLLGVGQYNKEAWNNFINSTIKPICVGIQQELTKKLILSPKWYVKFNYASLLDWDLTTISAVYGSLSDRGFVTGNEVRDKIGMSPRQGLDELRVLENYIPYELAGQQKKLMQNGGE